MRPVDRGDLPNDNRGNPVIFQEYGDARDPLIARIGDYCSYCEVALHGTIHVEHVIPKVLHGGLEKTWSNFLLAFDYCNSTKGHQEVILGDHYWPDTDNTARPFVYELDRSPQAAPWLDATQLANAQRTLGLTGVDREPGHPKLTKKDRRWLKRREVWGAALHERRKLQESDTPQQRDSVTQVAVSRGFWSVWMQVFHDDLDMRRRLILGFRGTAANCFDRSTQPVTRAGGQI